MDWHRKLSVEVPILLSFFGISLTGSLSANLLIYRTCYLILGYSEANCSLLGNTDNNITEGLEKLVEPKAQMIRTVQSTLLSIPMIIACIILGPWSDRFGRKPVLLLCQLGSMITSLIMALLCAIPTISPWVFPIAAITTVLTGGFPAYMTVAFSYLSDTTTQETRGMRMAIFEAFMGLGQVAGNLSGSALFYVSNYETVYGVAALCNLIGLVYTLFWIPESVENIEDESKVRGLVQTENIMEMVRVAVKKRDNFNRPKILLMATASVLVAFIFSGESSLTFPFLREKLYWTMTMYNTYSSVTVVIGIFSSLVGITILHKWMKIRESVLIFIGLLSLLNGSIMQGLATTSTLIYAAAFSRCFGGLMGPMLRTLVSKLVAKEEIAKIFSIMMISEFLVGLFAPPLYTYIFNSTINTNSGIFNFVSAGLYSFDVLLVGIVMVFEFYTLVPPYIEMENETESEIENINAVSA